MKTQKSKDKLLVIGVVCLAIGIALTITSIWLDLQNKDTQQIDDAAIAAAVKQAQYESNLTLNDSSFFYTKHLSVLHFNWSFIVPRCYGVKFTINQTLFPNMTYREKQYYFLGIVAWRAYPIITNLTACGNGTPIYREYKTIADFPLHDDCYNETLCFVKWNVVK